jgi:2-polyprenyl-3-methyl-5-hydroxy-6-metoxy-1,4-benzoquinol methylase
MKNNVQQLVCTQHSQLFVQDDYSLNCGNGCVYVIRNGIPRVIEPNYAGAFGFQWNRFQKTQLDSYTQTSVTRKRLEQSLGPELSGKLNQLNCLEVGCGAGRFTEILLELCHHVVSVDLSNAVDANNLNFPVSESHQIIQSDVMKLPFKSQAFELVLCLGVIQHTPSPEATIGALANQVKVGGWLVIDHYTKSIAWNLRSAKYIRPVLKRLPHEAAFGIIEKIYYFSKPLYQFSENRIYRKILNMVFPIVYFDKEIPELGKEFRDEWSILDSFDGLTDWYKHRRTKDEIRAAIESTGLTVEMCEYGGNGVIARAHRE